MWQDVALSVVQFVFVAALIPSMIDKHQKPAIATSAMNAAGMAVICATYLSLSLWASAAVAGCVGLCWIVLGYQRYRLDAKNPGA